MRLSLKRLAVLALSLGLIVAGVCAYSVSSTQVAAEESSGTLTTDGLSWTLDGDGTLTITGTDSYTKFTTVDGDLESHVDDVKEVVVGSGITMVGAINTSADAATPNVFSSFTNLKTISVESDADTFLFYSATGTATSLDIDASGKVYLGSDLMENDYLEEISITSTSDVVLSFNALSKSTALKTLTIDNTSSESAGGVTISMASLNETTSLESVVVKSKGTVSLGSNALYASAIKEFSVETSGSVSLGQHAFNDATSLKTVSLSATSVSMSKSGGQFEDCTSLSDFTITATDEIVIGAQAFYNTALEELELKADTITLYTAAFEDDAIDSLKIDASTLTFEGTAFDSLTADEVTISTSSDITTSELVGTESTASIAALVLKTSGAVTVDSGEALTGTESLEITASSATFNGLDDNSGLLKLQELILNVTTATFGDGALDFSGCSEVGALSSITGLTYSMTYGSNCFKNTAFANTNGIYASSYPFATASELSSGASIDNTSSFYKQYVALTRYETSGTDFIRFTNTTCDVISATYAIALDDSTVSLSFSELADAEYVYVQYLSVDASDNESWSTSDAITVSDGSITLSLPDNAKLAIVHVIKRVHTYGTVDNPCTDDVYCTECNAKVEAPGHSYSTVVTAPTCTEQGYTTYTCSVCEDTYDTNYTDANGHSYGDPVIVASTCTAAGSSKVTCSSCGDEVTTVLDIASHTPGDEATCTTPQTCTVCQGIITAATGHSYSATGTTAATCTTDGYTTYTCAACADTYNADYMDAFGHSYTGVLTTPPTSTTDGVITYTCTVCDVKDTVVVPALGAVSGSTSSASTSDGTTSSSSSVTNTVSVGNTVISSTSDEDLSAEVAVDVTEVLTKDEQAIVAEGGFISLALEVVETAVEAVSTAVKTVIAVALVEELSSDDSNVTESSIVATAYLDISLIKEIFAVGDNAEYSSETVTELPAAIQITINVPESIKTTVGTTSGTYYIVRIHDGVTEVLPTTYDAESGTITFETDRFSTYAIVFVEDVVEESVTVTPTVTTTSPKTGESGIACWLILALGIAVIGLGFAARKGRRF